ncbi:MAG: M24 family metallopeptidase [Hyphomicrobiaceae bacterium]
MNSPRRGFAESEYRTRLSNAQTALAQADLDALLLTTHSDIYYFTGYLTRFWESPTRPWFLIVPQSGAPTAVIPSIGAPLMASTWVDDIRTWTAPAPQDDGVSLLASTLTEILGKGRVGVPDGHETQLRMPLSDFYQLKSLLTDILIVGDCDIVRELRMIKSDAEVAKISHACTIASRAFDRVREIVEPGATLEQIFRHFQMLGLEEGADWVPYLAGGAGPDGYRDVISPATAQVLKEGEVLMLDTGLVWDGYFCDFDRNFSIGTPAAHVTSAYSMLIEATEAGFEAARPGNRVWDVFTAMTSRLPRPDNDSTSGRLGHGLGIQLTEKPSLLSTDATLLRPGMVLTLEPSVSTCAGHMLVHEENVVVTETGARYLSDLAPPKMVNILAER